MEENICRYVATFKETICRYVATFKETICRYPSKLKRKIVGWVRTRSPNSRTPNSRTPNSRTRSPNAEDVREIAPMRLERMTLRLHDQRSNQCRHELDADHSIKCAI